MAVHDWDASRGLLMAGIASFYGRAGHRGPLLALSVSCLADSQGGDPMSSEISCEQFTTLDLGSGSAETPRC